ncbi:MAG: ATP-dependent DNA helicase RecQ [Bacteroidota bacterium]
MKNIHHILKEFWGFGEFRPLQEDIINSVLNQNDTLALLPTGGGKSLCFQVPAMALDGVCIVISPLIALMTDQVENLKAKGIEAAAIFSGMAHSEIDTTLDNAVKGKYKFLYVAPERILTEMFKVRVQKMKVCFVAVDEAHCISQWGYDFRPSYLRIAELKKLLPNKTFLALTATATPKVVLDIQEKLEFKQPNVFSKSFERNNIAYIVQFEENKLDRTLKIIRNIGGTGIVYVRNRKRTQEIASYLKQQKISSDFYHAGLAPNERNWKQQAWKTNRCQVMVCTNAFGMGIDKPDVRFVVHLDVPDSLEAYFQEAGRAGRDEKKAYATILFETKDIEEAQNNLEQSFPIIDDIKRVYKSIGNYYQLAVGSGEGVSFDFDLNSFSSTFKLNPVLVHHSLRFLEKENYLSVSDNGYIPSRFKIAVSQMDLYSFQVKHVMLDNFIKLLLRSYSGAFDGFVNIYETEIAKRAGLPRDEVIKLLQRLHSFQIIEYVAAKTLPQLTFTKERQDEKSIYFSEQNYAFLKLASLEKLNAMLHYLQESNICRSKQLLAYFGDAQKNDCGQCDVCIEKKKALKIEAKTHDLIELIKLKLAESSKNLETLLQETKHTNKTEFISVLQYMLDNELISEIESDLYSIN